MYGNLHLPPNSTAISITEFGKAGSGGSQGEGLKQVYKVPDNATFLYIVTVSGGGSGGRPNAAAATAGAGGGGSSSITIGLFPTMLLPKTLWVTAGESIPGASANNTNGTGGSNTFVFMYSLPTGAIAAGNILIRSNQGGGGQASGTGGTGGGAMTAANAIWSTLGLWTSQVGVAGGAGAVGPASNIAFNATLPLTGGGGGAGSGSVVTGGRITAQAGYTQIPTISGGVGTDGAGASGMGCPRPWGGTGGAGGGGSNSLGTGLNIGGNAGWYGCGGGGGGNNGNAAPVSGNGGDGGPGYCLIVAF